MAKYKTVAGPAELWASGGADYEEAVIEYSRMINYEAFGGWKLHLIHKITVKKRRYYTIVIGAILGAILGGFFGSMGGGTDSAVFLGFVGLIVGILLGFLVSPTTSELFNMLVFVKDDDQKASADTDYDETDYDETDDVQSRERVRVRTLSRLLEDED